MTAPAEPDWTRRATAKDLDDLQGFPYMLRTSDDPISPWRSVKTRHQGWWNDAETGTQVQYVTVEFYNDDSQRVLNDGDEIEVGLIRPPWMSADTEPPPWPSRD